MSFCLVPFHIKRKVGSISSMEISPACCFLVSTHMSSSFCLYAKFRLQIPPSILFSYFTLFGCKSKTLFSFPATKFSIKGARYSISFCILKSTMYHKPANNQIPRCKQRGIKLATLQSSGVFDPRGIRQLAVQARPLGSLLAGIKAVRAFRESGTFPMLQWALKNLLIWK